MLQTQKAARLFDASYALFLCASDLKKALSIKRLNAAALRKRVDCLLETQEASRMFQYISNWIELYCFVDSEDEAADEEAELVDVERLPQEEFEKRHEKRREKPMKKEKEEEAAGPNMWRTGHLSYLMISRETPNIGLSRADHKWGASF